MILKAKKEYNLDLTKSFVIGDRNSDIVAGRNSGCKTILITSSDNSRLSDYTVENINQATEHNIGGKLIMKNPAKDLKVKIFADGADEETMFEMNDSDFIGGLTTNPTLMRKSGISDYPRFCKTILKENNKKTNFI